MNAVTTRTPKTPKASTRTRQRLATLGKLTVAGLLGGFLSYIVLLIRIGDLIVPILIVMGCLLLAAVVIASGWRWAPALGALLGIGTIIASVAQPDSLYHLTHPGELVAFTVGVFILAFGVLMIGAGIGATIQNYRTADRHAPRLLGAALSGLGGVVLGTLLVSALVSSTAPATTSATTAGGEPTVHMGPGNFSQPSVTVPKGSKLRLVDDGGFEHIIQNGAWVSNAPHPGVELGAPVVNKVDFKGNSAEVGPFTTAGTFHLYCTIHPGMNLTVTVQ